MGGGWLVEVSDFQTISQNCQLLFILTKNIQLSESQLLDECSSQHNLRLTGAHFSAAECLSICPSVSGEGAVS